ncbi:protein translocase SEC6 [Ascobolus immersus RN42]|uniref:Protein translocase SEC6 n=1 Tax=Ascobolus immersus RN42 TaxID=1160509 RepID=A0A3N4IQF5_ASCIM|nr:protein translocase SEC6 [Ascobolus immersus RN42]
MSEQIKEFVEMPKEFFRDGTQFLNKCVKPDKKEFLKISQAVGIGFVVMGAIGFIVKLIHIPVNNILVGGA